VASEAHPLTSSAAVPPWLWFWIPLFLFALPGYVELATQDFAAALDPPFGGSIARLLLILLAVLGVLPPVILLAGIAGTFAPGWRARSIERRYRLVDPPQNYPSAALSEVIEFLHHWSPGTPVKVCLTDVRKLAVVYPTSFRKMTVGVFGGLLLLWRRDRAAGEAVLLHELAHLRQGEVLFVHAGSPLVWGVQKLPWIVTAVVILQFVVGVMLPVSIFWMEWQEMAASLHAQAEAASLPPEMIDALQVPFSSFLSEKAAFFAHAQLPALALGAVTMVSWAAAAWVAFVAAIWCLEFNADRFAVCARPSALSIWLADDPSGQRPWWRKLDDLVTHPPLSLRRLLLRHAEDRVGLLALLLVFPAAYLVRLVLLIVWGVAVSFSVELDPSVGSWTRTYFTSGANVFAFTALVLLLWPFLAGHWESFVAGVRGYTSPRFFPVYWASAAATLTIAALGWIIA